MKKSSFFFLIFLLLFSFFPIRPLFSEGFFPMHDDTQIARVYEMAKSLSEGQFPVRIVKDLGYGYGYPLFNFYAPLPYYVGSFFCLLGFSPLVATKIMFGLGIILSAFTMFVFIRHIVGDIGALVCGIFYLYAPYHAVNIYVRGAVGEFYAYAFLPLVFLGLWNILREKKKENFFWGIVGLVGIFLSHNILGLITSFFLSLFFSIVALYLWIKKNFPPFFYSLVLMIIFSFGLSSFFLLPAFFERKYTRVHSLIQGGSDFHHHFVYLDQLWDSPWGYAGSAPGRADGMSFKIGKMYLIFGLFSCLFLFLKKRRYPSEIFNFYFAFFVLMLVSVFFTLKISEFFWEKIPFFPYIQYPWRFLNFILLSLIVLVSFLFFCLKSPFRIILAMFSLFSVVFFHWKYFVPKEIRPFVPIHYFSQENLKFHISKISDEYLPPDLVNPQNIEQVPRNVLSGNGNFFILSSQETAVRKDYILFVKSSGKAEINIASFPIWEAYLDSQKIPVENFQGRLRIFLPVGKHALTFVFQDTPIRKIGNTISLLTIFLLGYYYLTKKRRKRGFIRDF